MVAPTHAIRQECNLLTVCYIISSSINKKAPTQPQNIYGWVGVVLFVEIAEARRQRQHARADMGSAPAFSANHKNSFQ